ncbi:MAG: hypothetical protein K6E14_11160 [Paludibacteraceae bacterium]|nr:hypothetical protein [Paludibacteraceae bacterium]
MRYLSFILFLLILLIGLSSCDTREDWFAKEGEGATFIIKSCKSAWWDDGVQYEFRNDTIYGDNIRVVEYNVKVKDVHFSDGFNNITYASECVHLDIEGLGGKVEMVKKSELDMNITTDFPEPHFVQLDDHWYNFRNFYGAPTTNTDTIAPILNTAHMIIELEDSFRDKLYCHVKINCLGDIAPVPLLEIKDVDGNPMEKVFDLSKSHDKDGSVEKYEFCIDGEIVDYNSPVFDCRQDVAPAGKGAYGGTYITSTSLSEVKHAFQKEGTHVVYYRCMDNLGLWSLWYNELITVNK